eukprot:Nk52_evm90s2367 gene=Nk52_evmTU90s2367
MLLKSLLTVFIVFAVAFAAHGSSYDEDIERFEQAIVFDTGVDFPQTKQFPFQKLTTVSPSNDAQKRADGSFEAQSTFILEPFYLENVKEDGELMNGTIHQEAVMMMNLTSSFHYNEKCKNHCLGDVTVSYSIGNYRNESSLLKRNITASLPGYPEHTCLDKGGSLYDFPVVSLNISSMPVDSSSKTYYNLLRDLGICIAGSPSQNDGSMPSPNPAFNVHDTIFNLYRMTGDISSEKSYIGAYRFSGYDMEHVAIVPTASVKVTDPNTASSRASKSLLITLACVLFVFLN